MYKQAKVEPLADATRIPLFALIAVLSVCVACTYVFYMPYYKNRAHNYREHLAVADGPLCVTERLKRSAHPLDVEFLNQVHITGMNYKSLESTTCVASEIYVSTSIWSGALEDMWADSYLRVLLTADHIVLKVAYITAGLLGVWVFFRTFASSLVKILVVRRMFGGDSEQRAPSASTRMRQRCGSADESGQGEHSERKLLVIPSQ